jgi:hypothetical protein
MEHQVNNKKWWQKPEIIIPILIALISMPWWPTWIRYIEKHDNLAAQAYSSTSAPLNATAQCSDGVYSFSQTRSGTCSHHGGVSIWLK